MKIENKEQYKQTLDAIKEYEDQFVFENGKDCHVLIRAPELCIVLLDEDVADRMYENGNFTARTKGKFIGPLK